MVSGSSKRKRKRQRQQMEAAATATKQKCVEKPADRPEPLKPHKRSKTESNKTDTQQQLSLPSRLKRHRGTADSTPPPPTWSEQHLLSGDKAYLTPKDGSLFDSCRDECYRGFYWESPQDLPHMIHAKFDESLQALHKAGLFLYDAVQAGGKKVSKTYVTRTLIGNPGSTYRYLGLRLFSHPWCTDGVGNNKVGSLVQLGYSPSVAKALIQMGELNNILTQRTKQALKDHVQPHVPDGLVGSADFSLTLVNKMEPYRQKRDLKPLHGMNGKTSVGWHKDSGLQDFSSIAVYHTLHGDDENDTNDDHAWRVAMRVADNTGSCQTPPLSVPLPSGSLYYLLDDWNHTREHAVLAGAQRVRYSSTHRVAREGRGTWHYIRTKCQRVLSASTSHVDNNKHHNKSSKSDLFVKQTRAQQELLTEIEFEWLRQWHVQGKHHAELHPYWHEPIKQLMAWFQELERLTIQTIGLLSIPSKDEPAYSTTKLNEDLYDVMIESFQERTKQRDIWRKRLEDPIYSSMSAETRPFACPVLDRSTSNKEDELPDDLKPLVKKLRKWRTKFVSSTTTSSNVASRKKNLGLTKKETRNTNSNWEMLKSSMSARKK